VTHYARHRQPGQTIALAAVSMVALVGILAFVIDAGMFFVIRRELQNAADAGALAGAMYMSPDAPSPSVSGACARVSDGNTAGLPQPEFQTLNAVRSACNYANINVGNASRLCTNAGFDNAYTRQDPSLLPYYEVVVVVSCDAQYSFGRILLLTDRRISAYAIGALGSWDPSTGVLRAWQSSLIVPNWHDASRLISD
jgi:uncharacterized membrane protein